MTWQTWGYFSIVLATIALTTFLAWQGGRQREVAGNRYYSWLAAGMSLAALGEALSLLSPTPELALFWFKTRFFSFAFIPPLWLFFVLEYSGRKKWLAWEMVAGLLAIPAITQLMVWTSPLHDLWVQQEVGFYQVGAFWVADISQRVLGLWYLVHSFYGQLLMLAGSLLLAQTAWRLRQRYHWQAGLLLASALIPLVIAFITTFNLLPPSSLNPTLPGFALAALLAAAAVFRFDLLRKTPAAESLEIQVDTQEKRAQALFLLALGFLVVGIAALGTLSYVNYARHLRLKVGEQLEAVAALKVSDLVTWRDERLGDARVLRQNPALEKLAQEYLADPTNPEAAEPLRAWFDSLREAYQYGQVFLLDPNGQVQMISPAGSPYDDHTLDIRAQVLQGGEVEFVDFHQHKIDQSIRLSLLIPVFAEQRVDRPVGLVAW